MSTRKPRVGTGWFVLGRLVSRLFGLALLVQLGTVALSAWGIATFGGWESSPDLFDIDAVHGFDRAKQAFTVVGLSLDVVACLALSAWVYRAHRSDRASSEWTENGAWWAFGGWVIPPFCFFMPYGIIRDLRRGLEGREITHWRTLVWWWGTFWAGIWASLLASRMYVAATPGTDPSTITSSYLSGAWLDLVSGLLFCTSLVLLLAVLRTITRAVAESPFGAASVVPAAR